MRKLPPVSSTDVLILAGLFFGAAVLYSSVGHAGASGYLAVMALVGVSPAFMKPTALILNVLVAVVASTLYWRAGAFSWPIFWPFALASVPASFLGGWVAVPVRIYGVIVALVLAYAAARLFAVKRVSEERVVRIPLVIALVTGATIGFLSGLVGVGGGIFLTPLLLFCRWSTARIAAGVSAVFILVNSIAGLAGHALVLRNLPRGLPIFAAAVAIGGWLGATYGSRRTDPIVMRRVLAVVLVIASLKMLAAAMD